jgi:hypothetical protein
MTTSRTTTKTTYISATDTAKLVRQALKAAFPSVTFSVRTKTYSGGASIDCVWIDGPTGTQVEGVTYRYEGAHFDGMIDLKENVYHEVDGRRVSYGADYIHTRRRFSVAFAQRIADEVAARWGQPWPTIAADPDDGCARIDIRGPYVNEIAGYSLGDLINHALHETAEEDMPTIEDMPR